MTPPERPDLVIFDIDGTLLATDSFWLEVGSSAVAKVYAHHGIARDVPPAGRFLEAMGLPMRAFWEHVLPAEDHDLLTEIEAEAQELEEVAFAKGLGAMYPGARALLGELHSESIPVALASNCGRRYLSGFLDAFRLRDLVAEARCVDSPGIRSKADMVGDILRCTGARRPVLIGDRDGDRQAARGNRVPFILFTGGFGPAPAGGGERVAHTYGELRGMLLG